MKSIGIDHVEINVSNLEQSSRFYDALLGFLGYKRHKEEPEGTAGYYMKGVMGNVWLVQTEGQFLEKGFHRKTAGLNHLALRVATQEEVDEFARKFLQKNGIGALYGGPKAYPEYCQGYYAVFFEDPDRIKLEVMTLDDSKIDRES